MKNKILSISFSLVMILVSSYLAYEAWGNSIGYSNSMSKITQKLHMSDNLKTSGKKILETITFSWYDGYSQQVEELKKLKTRSNKYAQNAQKFTKAFIALALLILVFYLINPSPLFIVNLILISVIALITGWFSPILEITAYQDIPMLGNTIFQYESKSIISALQNIFQSEKYFIASIILLVTVITPIIKSILLVLISYKDKFHWSQKSKKFLTHVGKWSMLDVFVVAIIVTFFSMNAKGQTDASLQIGIYYFSLYVVLSMICTYLVSFKKTKLN